MRRTTRRYVFNTIEQFETKLKVFRDSEHENFIPNYHHIVNWGFELLEPQEVDESGKITKEAVYSERVLIDASWFKIHLEYDEQDNEYKFPYGWATYRVTPENPLHCLRGLENTYD